MLAVKLHKASKPWLGRGSFLLPIADWRTGRTHVKHWIWLLNRFNRGCPNDAIRFVSLVRIPDSHPVLIFGDCFEKYVFGWRKMLSKPLEQQELITQRLLMLWTAKNILEAPSPEAVRLHWFVQKSGPEKRSPEIILAKRLPASSVLWTKRTQLLYEKRKTRRRGGMVDDPR